VKAIFAPIRASRPSQLVTNAKPPTAKIPTAYRQHFDHPAGVNSSTKPKLTAMQTAIQPIISAQPRHPVCPKPSVKAASPMKVAGTIDRQPSPIPTDVFSIQLSDISISP
jgi:hypothetical protein